MRRRKAAGIYYYVMAIAAALLLLLPFPSGRASIIFVEGPPGPSSPPEPPQAQGVCDDVWAVPGFKPRYMVYDKVVNGEERFGPEVKGRRVSEVLQELRERLCADPALAIDLNEDSEGELGQMDAAYRTHWAETLTTHETEVITEDLLAYLSTSRANARIETYNGDYGSAYYVPGASLVDVPRLKYLAGITPRHSTFLSFIAQDGKRHYWRLECGFQPSRPYR